MTSRPESMSSELNIVNPHLEFPTVSLIEVSSAVFIHIAAALILKKSFHAYVLDNFAANNVAAMPILYRLA